MPEDLSWIASSCGLQAARPHFACTAVHQLQRDEYAKNALSEMSRNIKIIAMELVKGVKVKLSFAIVFCLS